MRRTVARLLWLIALAVPALALAHGGHEHRVMGIIKAVDSIHLDIEAQDGKTLTVLLDKDTKYSRGKSVASLTDIKVGDRAVVIGVEGKGGMKAKEVRLAPVGR